MVSGSHALPYCFFLVISMEAGQLAGSEGQLEGLRAS